MTTIVIDPVTRIEGHLRIEAVLKADGKTIDKAYSSSTMARGIEVIMKGRDPRDAAHISQRICGVCTVVHGLTSVRAVEDALGGCPTTSQGWKQFYCYPENFKFPDESALKITHKLCC